MKGVVEIKVCIVGAGNIGLCMAGEMALSGNDVTVYTNSPFDPSQFELIDEERNIKSNGLDVRCESNLEIALRDKDYVFCCYPAFLRRSFIAEAEKCLQAGCCLGFIPGYGGAEFMCANLLTNGVKVFGLQRVPFVARQEARKLASIISRKERLYLASIPKGCSFQIARDIEDMLGIPVTELKEYMAITLAPSNPLLHLTGLYNVFGDFQKGDYFDRKLMFYEEWTDSASELLLEYDSELQEICRKLPFDLTEVVPLSRYYESTDASSMTRKLKSIEAFKVVEVPLVEREGRFYPDWSSRMFVEDFPYGIVLFKYLALLTRVATPAMDTILEFYEEKTGICYFAKTGEPGKDYVNSGVPALYGIDTVEDLASFYSR